MNDRANFDLHITAAQTDDVKVNNIHVEHHIDQDCPVWKVDVDATRQIKYRTSDGRAKK